MKEENELGLLEFLTPGELPYRILVVESQEYLRPLRQMFPHGELWCVAAEADEDVEEQLAGLGIHWCHVNYLAERLPLEEKYFDYVLGENCLEQAGNPQDIATGLGLYLKDTGYFLMSFLNIRYWRVLENLMEGHFYHICSRIFARREMTKLMSASFYKDVQMLPVWGSEPPQGLMEKLQEAGFENIDNDLLVRSWMLQAAKSMPEILELKRMYTPEIRRELSILLRRLEYGIDAEKNLSALWQLCQENMIFPAYLASFIRETIIHINDLLYQLSGWQGDAEGQDSWQELLEELAEAYDDSEQQEYIIAWLQGNPMEKHQLAPALDKLVIEPGAKIAFITCVNNDEQYEECRLYLEALELPEGMVAEYIPIRDAKSMCQGYNQGAAMTEARYKVYLHQDALIVNRWFVFELLRIFRDETIGALGVIGARRLPASGIWWDGMRTYGRVLHGCEPECIVETACMEPPEPYLDVEAIDGLIMATQVDLPWREDLFGGWHFYEITMCKDLQRKGYRVVVPHQRSCWCIHCPKEKPLDPAYKIYQKRFLKEYGQELQPEI